MDALAPPEDTALLRGNAASCGLCPGPCAFYVPVGKASAAAGALPRPPAVATLFKAADGETETIVDPTPVARELAPYAALSSNSWFTASGRRRAAPQPAARHSERWLLLPPGWRQNRDLGSNPDDCKGGLHYEVWEMMSQSASEFRQAPIEVCIVFHGTPWWRFDDWRMNFRRPHCRAIFDALRSRLRITRRRLFGMDAFDRVADKAGRIFEYYRRQYPYHNLAFTSTGYALGGGLAQCLLYAHPARIKRVYAFHPSMVTGFHGQPASTRYQAYCDCPHSPPLPRILRIYAHGALRRRLRQMLRKWLPPGPHVHEVQFEFTDLQPPIARGAMMRLAGGILHWAGWLPFQPDRRRRRPEEQSTSAW